MELAQAIRGLYIGANIYVDAVDAPETAMSWIRVAQTIGEISLSNTVDAAVIIAHIPETKNLFEITGGQGPVQQYTLRKKLSEMKVCLS